MAQEVCIFCQKPGGIISRDHIFPSFLGGRKTIQICKPCNDYFGHAIEAKAAEAMRPLQVVLSSGGIPLMATPNAVWRKAISLNGQKLHLEIAETGMVPQIAEPMIQLDEKGKFKAGRFRTVKEAKCAMSNLRRKGQLSPDARIEEFEVPAMRFKNLPIHFSFGPELRRTLLKMAMSLASRLPEFTLADIHEGRLYLMHDPASDTVNCVRQDGVNCEAIDRLRKPLCHVIYAERFKGRVHGVLQLFGGIQLFCDLGRCEETRATAAMLATLDPISGKELIGDITALGLEYPKMAKQEDLFRACQERITHMMADAEKRGSRSLEISVRAVDSVDG